METTVKMETTVYNGNYCYPVYSGNYCYGKQILLRCFFYHWNIIEFNDVFCFLFASLLVNQS
jgi:hypothetical protein